MPSEYTNEEKMDEELKPSIELREPIASPSILSVTEGGTGSKNGSINGKGNLLITSSGGEIKIQGQNDEIQNGADINLYAGDTNGISKLAGDVNIVAGNYSGNSAGNGGSIVIEAGTGNLTNLGGEIDIKSGTGGATGPGGEIRISSADAGGGDNNGGNIVLTPGLNTGTGTKGKVFVADANSGISAIISTDSLATSNKTLIIPNASGTLALQGLTGTKIYYVADISGGATTRKLTFTDGILTAET